MLITPEEFQTRENTLNRFYLLLDQPEEEHVDCSCAGLAQDLQLSTQAELQPLNNVL